MRSEMFKAIENLKQNNGPHLNFFLQHALCRKENLWTQCLLNDLSTCDVKFSMNGKQVAFQNKVARRNNIAWPALNNLRVMMVDALLIEITKYFPGGSLKYLKY